MLVFRMQSHGEQKKLTALPRHREINNLTVKNTCKDLDIPAPKKK